MSLLILFVSILSHVQTFAISPSLSIDHHIKTPGSVAVPITALGLNNVGSILLHISYNSDVLTFTGYQNAVSASVIGASSIGDGLVSVSLTHFSSGLNINGTLIELLFEYSGGYSDFVFDFDDIWTYGVEPIHAALINGSINDITTGVPDITELQNLVVVSGDVLCFNANQTIIVAGSNAWFIIENGGSATLIAGQNIHLLPGTHVHAGGHFHAYITQNDEYCPTQLAEPVNEETDTKIADALEKPTKDSCAQFRLFPNPTVETFNIGIKKVFDEQYIKIEIYSIMGERLISEKRHMALQHTVSLYNQPPGLYIVRFDAGGQTCYKRLIKR